MNIGFYEDFTANITVAFICKPGRGGSFLLCKNKNETSPQHLYETHKHTNMLEHMGKNRYLL